MSTTITCYSIPDTPIQDQEEDLFPLTFTNNSNQNNSEQPPLLSYSYNNSSSSDSDFSLPSYHEDLLLNMKQDKNSISLINDKEIDYTNNDINLEYAANDDLIFELDNEFTSPIKMPTENKKKFSTITDSNINYNSTPDQSFANVAQQNYRLWLSSV